MSLEAPAGAQSGKYRCRPTIQDEDVSICKSVQRGLNSRAYKAGRLSVRREAGEHLFHRLLHKDSKAGVGENERAA